MISLNQQITYKTRKDKIIQLTFQQGNDLTWKEAVSNLNYLGFHKAANAP